jgi:hypothetical protein
MGEGVWASKFQKCKAILLKKTLKLAPFWSVPDFYRVKPQKKQKIHWISDRCDRHDNQQKTSGILFATLTTSRFRVLTGRIPS